MNVKKNETTVLQSTFLGMLKEAGTEREVQVFAYISPSAQRQYCGGTGHVSNLFQEKSLLFLNKAIPFTFSPLIVVLPTQHSAFFNPKQMILVVIKLLLGEALKLCFQEVRSTSLIDRSA